MNNHNSTSDIHICTLPNTFPPHGRLKSLFVVSTRHPQTKQFFKSIKARRIEQYKHTNSIHPFSVFNLYVKLLTTPLNFFTLFIISIWFGFFSTTTTNTNMKEDIPSEFSLAIVITGIILFIEVLLRFVTGYVVENNREIILHLPRIAWRYSTTWLLFDVGALLGIILQQINNNSAGAYLMLLHLFTLPRTFNNLNTCTEKFQIKDIKYRILVFFVVILVTTHFLTCLYANIIILVSSIDHEMSIECNTMHTFSFIYVYLGSINGTTRRKL